MSAGAQITGIAVFWILIYFFTATEAGKDFVGESESSAAIYVILTMIAAGGVMIAIG